MTTVQEILFFLTAKRKARHLFLAADVDGNTTADLVAFKDQGVWVSLSSAAGFVEPFFWVRGFGFDQGWLPGWHPRTIANVDGDGIPDLVGFRQEGVFALAPRGGRRGHTCTLSDKTERDGPNK